MIDDLDRFDDVVYYLRGCTLLELGFFLVGES